MEHIVLFARAPREGNVKTRLVPPLSPAQACALHRAMLEDQCAFLLDIRGDRRSVALRLDGPWPEDLALPPLPPSAPQGAGDLGARMARAIGEAIAAGAARVAILGADAPSLPTTRIEASFSLLLRGAEAALVPALDGGYVCLAVRGACPALLDAIPWGTPGVLAATRSAARRAGVRLEETAPWGDVDRPADLLRLAGELEAAPHRAPRTARLVASWHLDSPEFRMV